ncbi:MAG: D-alanyl-D-alanine carboxypeptidase [Bacilli bacterium]|nr:D-alanyl-D-alanine carboxypeptidase [Bacilli bacterium]
MRKIVIILIIFLSFKINVLGINDTSHSSIVMDIDSGRILYQKDSNTKRLIASTTKLMTFLTALKLGEYKLDDEVKVGEEVLKMYGTNMYLSVGEIVTLRDLLYGLILRSGNDASVVIATYLSGSTYEFVNEMNKNAKLLGMNNSVFYNPHGLDEETKNYSTAYDLGVLTRYLYLNYPEFLEIGGSKYYNFQSNLKSYELINRCKIIFTYKNITTAKNGYTPKSGKSLVTTASKNNLNLLIVTLDDYNIYENHERLYEYFFNKYENYLIIDKNSFKIPNSLFKDKYYLKNNFYYPITNSEKDKIETKILTLEKDNILGKISVSLNKKIIHEEPIYKLESQINKESFFNKIKKIFR